MGASAGRSGGWLAVRGRGRGRRAARVQRGHEGGSGAERLVLARGDEREAALDRVGREGRRPSHSSRDQGAARLEGAVVEEDGDNGDVEEEVWRGSGIRQSTTSRW